MQLAAFLTTILPSSSPSTLASCSWREREFIANCQPQYRNASSLPPATRGSSRARLTRSYRWQSVSIVSFLARLSRPKTLLSLKSTLGRLINFINWLFLQQFVKEKSRENCAAIYDIFVALFRADTFRTSLRLSFVQSAFCAPPELCVRTLNADAKCLVQQSMLW